MTDKEKIRSEKLNDLQTKHRKLLAERVTIQTEYKAESKVYDKIKKKLDAKNKEIRDIGEQIFHLKHTGDTPHVTDHAVVRYLERVEGIDIWDLKTKVAAHKDAVLEGNVIVTINENLEGVE